MGTQRPADRPGTLLSIQADPSTDGDRWGQTGAISGPKLTEHWVEAGGN